MPATLILHNEKPAAATIRGGLNLVSTATPTHEEQMHVLYHDQGAYVQSRD